MRTGEILVGNMGSRTPGMVVRCAVCLLLRSVPGSCQAPCGLSLLLSPTSSPVSLQPLSPASLATFCYQDTPGPFPHQSASVSRASCLQGPLHSDSHSPGLNSPSPFQRPSPSPSLRKIPLFSLLLMPFPGHNPMFIFLPVTLLRLAGIEQTILLD